MPRALLAWEFGGDLGHARRAVAVARQLRALGHEATFAFADLAALDPADADGFERVPAPRLPRPPLLDPSPLTASDILLNLGLGDAAALAGALAAWTSLFRLFRPDVVVCDYSPSALLAAHAARLPRVTLGSGFSAPPVADPMPLLRSWATVDPRALAQRDARLIESVRQAWSMSGANGLPPARARELFQADAHLVCTWPEIDPFGPREDVEYLGPQPDTSATLAASWTGEPRVFAYLKPRDERFEAVLAAIARLAGDAIVAAPGLSDAEAAARSGDRLRVFARPVALEVLRRAHLCVSHGGPGIVAAAMHHGVPQALLPMHLEQYLVARRASSAGIASVFEPDAAAQEIEGWLGKAFADAALAAAARSVASSVAARVPASAAERISRHFGR